MNLWRLLPVDGLIDCGALFVGGAPQIDSCCLYALVAHEIGKQGYIGVTFDEVLCEQMTKRMRVNHVLVNTVAVRSAF